MLNDPITERLQASLDYARAMVEVRKLKPLRKYKPRNKPGNQYQPTELPSEPPAIQPAKKPSFVYVISCSHYIKIGIATNVLTRLREMQVGNPFRLQILAILPTFSPRASERKLHLSLSQYRMCGEWFNIPKRKLKNLLKTMLPGPKTPERKIRNQGLMTSKFYRAEQKNPEKLKWIKGGLTLNDPRPKENGTPWLVNLTPNNNS